MSQNKQIRFSLVFASIVLALCYVKICFRKTSYEAVCGPFLRKHDEIIRRKNVYSKSVEIVNNYTTQQKQIYWDSSRSDWCVPIHVCPVLQQ